MTGLSGRASRLLWSLVLVSGLLSLYSPARAGEGAPTLYIIRIQGAIDPPTAQYLEDRLREAQSTAE